MKALLLGVGLQGKTALYDLHRSSIIDEIIAADIDLKSLEHYVEINGFDKVQCEYLDATKQESIDQLLYSKPDVVIDLLPFNFIDRVVETVIEHGIHYVNTNSRTIKMKELAKKAEKKDIAILPEFGLDPGIDLVLLGEAKRRMDEIEEIIWYGAGIPELEAADNPLKYKETWTFDGVLSTYFRPAKIIRNGKIVEIKDNENFNPENIHTIRIDEIGLLEAFPNGDVLGLLDKLGIKDSESSGFENIQNMGRYTLRWPGHCEFWKKLVDLQFLNNEPLIVNGIAIDRKKYLLELIRPQIQLKQNERDIAIVRIEVVGKKAGEKTKAVYQVIDKRDLQTGFTAMNRTVGYTVSIGAQFILKGTIIKRGLLSPVTDIPYDLFERELKERGINIQSDFKTNAK